VKGLAVLNSTPLPFMIKVFFISLTILIIITSTVLAFNDQPINISDKELKKILEKDNPNEIPISFWELPLWIKIHYIVTVFLGLLATWKLLPIVITKVKSALENVKRRKILRIIMENQGLSLTELEKITGENRSTLRFHLSKLEQDGWIKSVKRGKNRLILLNTSNINPTAVVKGRKREIIELLKESGGLTLNQIAERLKLNVKTVYYHLKELRKMGILTRNKEGKYKLE